MPSDSSYAPQAQHKLTQKREIYTRPRSIVALTAIFRFEIRALPEFYSPLRCSHYLHTHFIEAELPMIEAFNEPDDAAGEVEELDGFFRRYSNRPRADDELGGHR